MDLYDAEFLDPPRVADIYYAGGMGRDWERLVWTKEMMNILDSCDGGDSVVASDEDKVARLVNEMVTPPDIYSHPTVFDRGALLWALFLLFPRAIRDLLVPPYHAGKITIDETASIVEIPARYIQWAMTDRYVTAYDFLVEGLAPDPLP